MLVRAHKADARRPEVGLAPEQLRVDQIDRTHIQRGRDADASAELDHALNEIQADLAVVETPVDVRSLGVDEPRCSNGFREPDEQCHRKACGGTVMTAQKVPVQIGKNHAHDRIGPPACSGFDPKAAS